VTLGDLDPEGDVRRKPAAAWWVVGALLLLLVGGLVACFLAR
jgi:hypothetical protein